jgi:hypothetical protein
VQQRSINGAAGLCERRTLQGRWWGLLSENHGMARQERSAQEIQREVSWLVHEKMNPFSVLLEPAAVLAKCAISGVLDALPVSALRTADRPGTRTSERLRAHDEAIDALFARAMSKVIRERRRR